MVASISCAKNHLPFVGDDGWCPSAELPFKEDRAATQVRVHSKITTRGVARRFQKKNLCCLPPVALALARQGSGSIRYLPTHGSSVPYTATVQFSPAALPALRAEYGSLRRTRGTGCDERALGGHCADLWNGPQLRATGASDSGQELEKYADQTPNHAWKDEPQPQLPVTFGLPNLKPEPWTPST